MKAGAEQKLGQDGDWSRMEDGHIALTFRNQSTAIFKLSLFSSTYQSKTPAREMLSPTPTSANLIQMILHRHSLSFDSKESVDSVILSANINHHKPYE